VRAGRVEIPDTPGVGLDWDEAAVAAHLVPL
jgi:L-alanine-DL-glutamate epimerase-like enolase superfamily enzyme